MTYTYPTTKQYDCCEHCMHWSDESRSYPLPDNHPNPCSYIINLDSNEPNTTCQERK